MRRLMLRLLLYIFAWIAWGFAITWIDFVLVMKQPFLAAEGESRFYFGTFIPRTPSTRFVELKIAVPTRHGVKGDNCEVKIRWPKDHQIPFNPNANNGGMPLVGDDAERDLFFAKGLELQLRIVRNDFVEKWNALADKTMRASYTGMPRIDISDADNNCVGNWGSDINVSTFKAVQEQIVGNKGSEEFAKVVREEFRLIQGQAFSVWVTWVVVVPLLFVVFYIVRILMRVPWD